jgi:hypothetical protein
MDLRDRSNQLHAQVEAEMGRLAVVRQGLAATAEQPALVNHLYFGECIYAENDLRRFPAGLILILSAFLLSAGVTTSSPAHSHCRQPSIG